MIGFKSVQIDEVNFIDGIKTASFVVGLVQIACLDMNKNIPTKTACVAWIIHFYQEELLDLLQCLNLFLILFHSFVLGENVQCVGANFFFESTGEIQI